jgi:hypothetical protein
MRGSKTLIKEEEVGVYGYFEDMEGYVVADGGWKFSCGGDVRGSRQARDAFHRYLCRWLYIHDPFARVSPVPPTLYDHGEHCCEANGT